MKTKDNEIKPFTAMYQNIDEQRGISAFTLQNVKLKGKKRCINKNVTSFNSSTRK